MGAFSIDTYSKNEVSAAPELELRDRGYLSVGEMQRHQQAGAHFIYRHKTGALYRDEPMDLPELLRRHGSLDREVSLNDAHAARRRPREPADGRPVVDEVEEGDEGAQPIRRRA